MGRPEPARRIRLWAASTNYADVVKMPYSFLINYRIKLFEIGRLASDILDYKRTLVIASAPFQNEKQTNKLIEEYRAILLPDLGGDNTDGEMTDLMSELENTIVTIDKDSARKGMAS